MERAAHAAQAPELHDGEAAEHGLVAVLAEHLLERLQRLGLGREFRSRAGDAALHRGLGVILYALQRLRVVRPRPAVLERYRLLQVGWIYHS